MIKLAALPLFILTVMVTKIFIDHSQNKQLTLSHLFLAEAAFLTAFGGGFIISRLLCWRYYRGNNRWTRSHCTGDS